MDLGPVVFMYFLAAVIVGFFVLRDVGDESHLIKDKKKKLGPAYWGSYQGLDAEPETMQTIKPPEPCKDSDGVAGRGNYASGKAVKSAR